MSRRVASQFVCLDCVPPPLVKLALSAQRGGGSDYGFEGFFSSQKSGAVLTVLRARQDRPLAARDCTNCGLKDGMRLQNVGGTAPVNIPLLYICTVCGTTLTIPPPRSPLKSI